jgi:hypothetical protein
MVEVMVAMGTTDVVTDVVVFTLALGGDESAASFHFPIGDRYTGRRFCFLPLLDVPAVSIE